MAEEEHRKPRAGSETVKVRVAPEESMRFRAGTRWKVVGSSVESLWEAQHTITLEEIARSEDA